ncbi:hypothetical protein KW807_02290 [Candidatus Parcubacteria bacterium]|nr:hypothetical protein [Candidatus Parcubacteria bacterium]
MENKRLIWLGAAIGSTIGSYVPTLWGAGMVSFSSVILGGVGGIVGIYIFYKITR